jgi:hypothetical protein
MPAGTVAIQLDQMTVGEIEGMVVVMPCLGGSGKWREKAGEKGGCEGGAYAIHLIFLSAIRSGWVIAGCWPKRRREMA